MSVRSSRPQIHAAARAEELAIEGQPRPQLEREPEPVTLVTQNRTEFARVPDLCVENWNAPLARAAPGNRTRSHPVSPR